MVVMVNNKSTGSCSRSCKSLTVSFFSANALPYPKVSLLPTAVEVTRDLNFGIESKQECVSSENSSDRFLSVSCFWLSCLLLLALASPRWNFPRCNICCLLKRLRGFHFFCCFPGHTSVQAISVCLIKFSREPLSLHQTECSTPDSYALWGWEL